MKTIKIEKLFTVSVVRNFILDRDGYQFLVTSNYSTRNGRGSTIDEAVRDWAIGLLNQVHNHKIMEREL